MKLRDLELQSLDRVGLLSPYKPHMGSRPEYIGKKSVKYKGKVYRRWKAGFSPIEREAQKLEGDPKLIYCECGADYGQYHELGCDLETCPICGKQLLTCGHCKLFEADRAKCR